MSDAVLVLNSGSSSVKFALFDSARSEPTMRYKGLLDEQEKSPRLLVTDPKGKTLFERRHAAADNEDTGLFIDIFDWNENYLGDGGLAGVGHRIVHGGRDFSGPVEVTSEVLDALWALTPLAPLHQPRCLAPIRAIRSLQPNLR